MTPDKDLSARLAELRSLSDDSGDAQTAFIRGLSSAYRSGQLITLADHQRTVQDAVAKAVEAERARNNRSLSAATLFWVRASQKALAGDTRELQNRVDLCTADPAEIVLSAAAIRSRGVAT